MRLELPGEVLLVAREDEPDIELAGARDAAVVAEPAPDDPLIGGLRGARVGEADVRVQPDGGARRIGVESGSVRFAVTVERRASGVRGEPLSVYGVSVF